MPARDASEPRGIAASFGRRCGQARERGMKLGEIAQKLGCRLEGDAQTEIRGVAGIDSAATGALTFVSNPRYRQPPPPTPAPPPLPTPHLPASRHPPPP